MLPDPTEAKATLTIKELLLLRRLSTDPLTELELQP